MMVRVLEKRDGGEKEEKEVVFQNWKLHDY